MKAPSECRIKWYVRRLNAKLGTSNRDEIVSRAYELGILKSDMLSLTPMKHNLPRQTTHFIGREDELQEIATLLETPELRLLTILAPGGMGKTRLALEVAKRQITNFKDGVFFVSLQPLSDTDYIIPAIADGVSYQFQPDDREPKKQIFDYLKSKQVLLVIDNYEHLLDGATIVSELLIDAPEAKVLVTSRERLNLREETIFRLEGMDFPDTEMPEDALEYSAVKLFLQNVRRVQASFAPKVNDLRIIAQICQLLGGMPLGIILVATWLDALTLEEITVELRHNLDLLETDVRNLPERHRSIRAVFEPTWKRLPADERELFMKSSVFRGGFTREAVENVAGATARQLNSLVNKALLWRNLESKRYEIHELVRQYAEEQLEANGQSQNTLQRHAGYFVELAEEAEPNLRGVMQMQWYRRLEAEHANFRRALMWSLNDNNINFGLRLVSSLNEFWHYHGHHVEGEWWAMQALEYVEDDSPLLQGRVLCTAGHMAFDRGNWEQAKIWFGEALDIFRALDDKQNVAYTLLYLTITSWHRPQEHEAAIALAEEAVNIVRSLNDRPGIARSIYLLAVLFWFHRDYTRARVTFEEALTLLREIGNKWHEGWALILLGESVQHLGDYPLAESLIKEGLNVAWGLKYRYCVAMGLSLLAGLHLAKGQTLQGTRLLGTAQGFLQSRGIVYQPGAQQHVANIIATARKQLDDAVFESAWAEGQARTIEQVLIHALEGTITD